MTRTRPRAVRQTADVAARWPVALLLVVVVLLAYAPSLSNGFSFDDADVITGAADLLNDPAAIGKLASRDYFRLSLESTYRPLVTLSYMIDWQLGGGAPWVFHAQSVLWHLVSVVCFLTLLTRLGAGLAVAGLAAALYGLHPAITEAVDGASFREDLLVTAFGLLSIVLSTSTSRRRPRRTIASLLCVAAACLSKESGVVLGALWPLTHWTAARTNAPDGPMAGQLISEVRARRWEYAGLAAVLALYLIVRFAVFPSPSHYGIPVTESFVTSAATGLVVLGYYLRLVVVPWPLCADYRGVVPYVGSMLDPRVWAALAAVAALTWIAIHWRRRHPLILWGWLWFLIAFLPVSNLVPIPHFMAERFLHLPYVGLVTVVVMVVAAGNRRWMPGMSRVLALAGVAALIVCGALTWQRHAVWMSNNTLWAATLTDYPTSHGGLQGYAGALIESGRYAEAMPYLEGVLGSGTATRERKASVLVDLGYAQAAMGALEPARRSFQASVDLLPSGRAYQNLAIVSMRLRRMEDAEAEAKAAVRLQPDSAEAHSILGAVFLNQRRSGEALAEYREALRLQPSLVSAQEGMRRLGN